MLSHIDENNMPRMVDVGAKDESERVATASGIIRMSAEAFAAVKQNTAKKGPVLQTAVVAAIMGAKKTSELIPMTHPLTITSIKTDIEELASECAFKLFVTVKITGKTGVEMEALTGVSVGLLTIYDMLKAIDKSMQITDVVLQRKEGARVACILGAEKPKIDYPLFWEYKVVLDATTQKHEQIDEILKGENYKIDFSRFSNGGKYMSFNVSVFVKDDLHRNEIFERLKVHFKYVL